MPLHDRSVTNQWEREPLEPELEAPDEAPEPREADAEAADAPAPALRELPPALFDPPRRAKPALERGAEGGATERDAIEKLRALAGAETERALGLPATRVACAAAGTAPFAPRAASAAELELTKRCELASNANAEPRLTVATLPLPIVRETREGAAEALTREFTVFVGTDFKAFHCSPVAGTTVRATTPSLTV